jgi:hypothetical protein
MQLELKQREQATNDKFRNDRPALYAFFHANRVRGSLLLIHNVNK